MVIETPTPNGPTTEDIAQLQKETDESVDQVLRCAYAMFDYLREQPEKERAELRKWVAAQGFDTKTFGSALKRLSSTDNAVTEYTTDDGRKVFALKEWCRSLEYRQVLQSRSGAKEAKAREKYSDFYEATGTITFITPCLAGNVVPGEQSLRTFDRTTKGDVILRSGYFRAMAFEVARMGVIPAISALTWKSMWGTIIVDQNLVGRLDRPVPPRAPGMPGSGITNLECLPTGTTVGFKVLVPGSHIDPATLQSALDLAGEYCGISPSAHKQGYGRFTAEVTSVQARSFAPVYAPGEVEPPLE